MSSAVVDARPRRPLLLKVDFVIIGLLLSFIAPWTAFVLCGIFGAYARYIRYQESQRFLRLFNEWIAANTNQGVADFIAPLLPAPKGRWTHTANGAVFVEEP